MWFTGIKTFSPGGSDMGATVSPGEVLEPPKSFVARFAGVFFSPGATFADIARKPDWVAPLVVMVLASVAGTETMLWKIGMERIVRQQIEHSSRGATMTPEQVQQGVEQGARIGGIIAHVAGFLGVPVGSLIIAGIGMLVASAVFGSPMKFATAFSIACYAGLVNILSMLMALAMILYGDPEHFNPQSPVPSNAGFFLGPETSKPLMSLASSFDIFTLWLMALLAIGFSAATNRKAKSLSLFWCFFGLWMVLVLIKMVATLG
jgi:hypothetical protein